MLDVYVKNTPIDDWSKHALLTLVISVCTVTVVKCQVNFTTYTPRSIYVDIITAMHAIGYAQDALSDHLLCPFNPAGCPQPDFETQLKFGQISPAVLSFIKR